MTKSNTPLSRDAWPKFEDVQSRPFALAGAVFERQSDAVQAIVRAYEEPSNSDEYVHALLDLFLLVYAQLSNCSVDALADGAESYTKPWGSSKRTDAQIMFPEIMSLVQTVVGLARWHEARHTVRYQLHDYMEAFGSEDSRMKMDTAALDLLENDALTAFQTVVNETSLYRFLKRKRENALRDLPEI